MRSFSHIEVVVLALLSGGRSHAYELLRRVQSMKVEKWARVRESTLYASLRRLERRGLVRGEDRASERAKSKRIYRSTAKGRARLEELVASGLSSPAPMYSDLLVAALFSVALAGRVDFRPAIEAVKGASAELSEARRDPNLSEPGRVVVDFYLGLSELHLEALGSLQRLARSPRRERYRGRPGA